MLKHFCNNITKYLKFIVFFVVVFVVITLSPLMTNFDSSYMARNNQDNLQNNESLSPTLNNTSTNLNQFNNPDVAYAQYIAQENTYAVRIGSATNVDTNPANIVNPGHATYFQSPTIVFANNGTATVRQDGNDATLTPVHNGATNKIRIIDFASNTGVPMVSTSTRPNQPLVTGNNTAGTLPYPYHIPLITGSSSTPDSSVKNVTSVEIRDDNSNPATFTGYSSIEEVGFYSFSGLTRYFEPVNGKHGWYTYPGSATTLPFFEKLKTVTFKTSDTNSGSLSSKLGLKVVRNGAFYKASSLVSVDFGVDNRLTAFDTPWGSYPGFATSQVYTNPWSGGLGDYDNPAINISNNALSGIFTGDVNLEKVSLWQKYYGWDADDQMSETDNVKYHAATLLNIPPNMFRDCSKLSYFNTSGNSKMKGVFALPSSVVDIGDYCLEGATKITSVIFSEDIRNIGRLSGTLNEHILNFQFPRKINNQILYANNAELYTSLINFIARNCNDASKDYWIQIPYESNTQINDTLYYQTIFKQNTSSNVHIVYSRPKKFGFINWKADLGTYNGRKDLDNVILNSNINYIVIRPIPSNTDISELLIPGVISVSAPLRIYNPNNTSNIYGDGVAIQVNCKNDVERTGTKSQLKITVNANYPMIPSSSSSPSFPAVNIVSSSIGGKIGWYSIDAQRSFTFGNTQPNDGGNGYTSFKTSATIRLGETAYLGNGLGTSPTTDDVKYVDVKSSNSVNLDLTGVYAGVDLKIVNVTKGGSSTSAPNWIEIIKDGFAPSPNDPTVGRQKFHIKITPPSAVGLNFCGTYTFQINVNAISDPAKIANDGKTYSLYIWNAQSLQASPACSVSTSDASKFSGSGEHVGIKYLDDIRGTNNLSHYYSIQYIGGNQSNLINSNYTYDLTGSFNLPSYDFSFQDGYSPPDVSSAFTYEFSNFTRYSTYFTSPTVQYGSISGTVDTTWGVGTYTSGKNYNGVFVDNFITQGYSTAASPNFNNLQPQNNSINYAIKSDSTTHTNGYNPKTNYEDLTPIPGQHFYGFDLIYFDLKAIPTSGDFAPISVTYCLVIVGTDSAIWNNTTPYLEDPIGVPNASQAQTNESGFDPSDRPSNKTVFILNTKYIYQDIDIFVSATCSTAIGDYSYNSTGVLLNSSDLVIRKKSADIGAGVTSGYWIHFPKGELTNKISISKTAYTHKITFTANHLSSPLIYKTITFIFWEIDEKESTISNDNSLAYPNSSTPGTITDSLNNSYNIADTTRQGANSYYGNFLDLTFTPIFSQTLNYNLKFTGSGYPTSFTQSNGSTLPSAYQYDVKWYLKGTNPLDDTIDEVFGQDTSAQDTGIDIRTSLNNNTGKKDGLIYWQNLGNSLTDKSQFDKIKFNIGFRVQFNWENDLHGTSQTKNCTAITGKISHDGPKIWNFDDTPVSRPASFVDYAYDETASEFIFPNQGDTNEQIFKTKAYKINKNGAVTMSSGQAAVPASAWLTGTNITNNQVWTYEIEDISNNCGWLHIANNNDGSGYEAGTIYWNQMNTTNVISDGSYQFNIVARSTSRNSYGQQFEVDYHSAWGLTADYLIEVETITDYKFVYADISTNVSDPATFFDNGYSFNPNDKIVMRAFETSTMIEPSSTSFKILIDTNKNLQPGLSNDIEYSIRVLKDNGQNTAEFFKVFSISYVDLANPRYKLYTVKISAPVMQSSVTKFHLEISLKNSKDTNVSKQFQLLLWKPKNNPVSNLKYATNKYTIFRRTINNYSRFDGESVVPTYKTNIEHNWSSTDEEFKDFQPFNNGALSFKIIKVTYGGKDISEAWFNTDIDQNTGETKNKYSRWLILNVLQKDERNKKAGTIVYDINEKYLPTDIDTFFAKKYKVTIQANLYDIYSPEYADPNTREKTLLGGSSTDVEFTLKYGKPVVGGNLSWLFIVLIVVGGGIVLYFFIKNRKNSKKGKALAASGKGGASAANNKKPNKLFGNKEPELVDEEEEFETEKGTGFGPSPASIADNIQAPANNKPQSPSPPPPPSSTPSPAKNNDSDVGF